METGFDIRFDPTDGDPVSTVVDYVGGADSSLDMLEAARALLVRAADFVNVDDGYLMEAAACCVVYQLVSGATDCMAADDPVSLDPDFVSYTLNQHVLLHTMRLLRDNPAPDWTPPE
jgi:hypothetical protein